MPTSPCSRWVCWPGSSDLIDLPAGWEWLSNGWVMVILALLLAVEVVADKVPVVDHVNDMVQTVVRPTAGGLAFGAGSSSETVTVTDPGSSSARTSGCRSRRAW